MRNLLLSAALAASVAMPAVAGNWSIAIRDALPHGGEDLNQAAWAFFLRHLGPGDRYTVLNATVPGQIASISVPDDARYTRPKWRAQSFAQENRRIADHLGGLEAGDPDVDLIGVLRHVALSRIDPERPLDLMIVGSALQRFLDTLALSMGQGDAVFIPSPEHLTASVRETPYGIGAEGPGGLQNIYLHLCPIADDLRSDEAAALQSVYGRYVAARGGTLVTWSQDLATCFERWAAEVRDPLEIAPYGEATGQLAMVPVGQAEIVVEPEPTTVIVNGIEVDQFNLFSTAPHPTLTGVEVTTGVVYEPGKYPDVYEQAYCYFNVRQAGTHLRLDLGEKRFGRAPSLDHPSTATLRAAGITRGDYEAGRTACQWPTD